MKRLKMVIFGVLATVALLSAACSNGARETSSGNSGTAKDGAAQYDPNVPVYLRDTSPITLDWYVDEEWYTRVKWGDDLTSKYITGKTGVTLNIIIPKGDSSAYKTTMIASGDLPDVIEMGQWLSEWRTMRDNDMLWSFQDLAEKYDQSFFDVMRPSILTFWREENGLNYVYPNSAWGNEDLPNAKYLISSGAFSVRKDIYEAIGSPSMKTPEELLSALRLAKEKYPEINGQPIIPFLIGREFTANGNSSLDQGGMKWLLNLPANEKDFYTYDLNTDPEITRWLKAMNQAYNEGLISNDQFTDKETQINEKLQSGRVFATIAAANTIAEFNATFYEKDPDTMFIPIEAMLNSKGDMSFYAAGGLAGWHVSMITKDCKDPVRAAQFFHYYLSEEGQSDFYYGDPSMWDMKDGRKWLKDDLYALRSTDEAEFCSVYGGMDSYFMLIQPVYSDDKFLQTIQPWKQAYYDFFSGKIRSSLVRVSAEGCDPDSNTPESVEYLNLQAKWGELLPMMIIAGSEAEFNSVAEQYKAASDAAWPKYGFAMRAKFEFNLKKFDLY